MTLTGATLLLALVSTGSVLVSAIMAYLTNNIAQENKKIVVQNEMHHRQKFRPICTPVTINNLAIAEFEEVIGTRYLAPQNFGIDSKLANNKPTFYLKVANKGLGPALNVRLHINDVKGQRITRDFLVAHVLPSNDEATFYSEIPLTNFDSIPNKVFRMIPEQVMSDAYFIVCEYESVFSGEAFHSVVAKGYRDPYLANDGKNLWRYSRPTTPPIEVHNGLDTAKPIWPMPPDDAEYPGSFLNFPPQS